LKGSNIWFDGNSYTERIGVAHRRRGRDGRLIKARAGDLTTGSLLELIGHGNVLAGAGAGAGAGACVCVR